MLTVYIWPNSHLPPIANHNIAINSLWTKKKKKTQAKTYICSFSRSRFTWKYVTIGKKSLAQLQFHADFRHQKARQLGFKIRAIDLCIMKLIFCPLVTTMRVDVKRVINLVDVVELAQTVCVPSHWRLQKSQILTETKVIFRQI